MRCGLEVNAYKSLFHAMETEYLGYIFSQDGIKPQHKNVQEIFASKVKEMSLNYNFHHLSIYTIFFYKLNKIVTL